MRGALTIALLLGACAHSAWRPSLPLQLVPGRGLGQVDRNAIAYAAAHWEGILGPGSIHVWPEGRGTPVLVTYKRFEGVTIGDAAVRAENGCVLSGTIRLDPRMLRRLGGTIEASWVIAHEMGHVLGLLHSGEVSLMHPTPAGMLFALSDVDAVYVAETLAAWGCTAPR